MTRRTQHHSDGGSGQQERYAHGDSSVMAQYHTARTASSHAGFFLHHLRPGMSLLDCGCGSGAISVGLAEAVAPGQVVGIDIAEGEIERARSHASEYGISNSKFEVASVYDLPFSDGGFDAVFSHALLEHLDEPIKALREMHRVLKSEGLVGVSDVDCGGVVIGGPHSEILERSLAVYEADWNQHGGSSRMGRHVRALLHEVGFGRIEATASCERYGTPDAVRWFSETWPPRFKEQDFVDRVVKNDLADEATLNEIRAAWKEWGDDPGSFLSYIWCEAVGWKG